MPHLISNLYEKAYTPFTAKLAPRHLWSKPTIGTLISFWLLLSRQKTTKGFQIRSWPNRQSNLEIYQKMDRTKPQALLYLRLHL